MKNNTWPHVSTPKPKDPVFGKEFDTLGLVSEFKQTDLLVVPVFEGSSTPSEVVTDKTFAAIAKKNPDFSGKNGEELLLYNEDPKWFTDRFLFIGLGKKSKINPEALRQAGGKAVKKGMAMEKVSHITIMIPKTLTIKQTEALMEGACLANHVFDKFKSEPKKKKEDDNKGKELRTINFLTSPEKAKKLQVVLDRVAVISAGTKLAREWVTMPPNYLTPGILAKQIQESVKNTPNTECTIFPVKKLTALKMGGITAVGGGSDNPPCMVIIDYKPKKFTKTIALVGKGITFDSGGINLKSTAGIDKMNEDMAGAAAVAGVMAIIAKLQPKGIQVIAAMPLAENMPSGTACRPGDIITIYGGKTVTIENTDAEGRLILADALAYLDKKYKPDMMVDLATLTGACVVALGENISGIFSPDEKFGDMIVAAGKTVYERCWPMPMPDDYKEMMKGKISDVYNMGSGGRWGGAIAAALFLSEFVEKTKKWAHIDIAGPALFGGQKHYCGNTASGFGVRLLIEFLKNL